MKTRYESVGVPVVEHEDRFPQEAATDVWEDIYTLFRATSEQTRDEVRVAVYAYFAVNGTSRVGKYSRGVTSGSETVVVHEIVKQITGGTIREFFRADVVDAYHALKDSGVLENDEVFVQKALDKGVPRGFVHCAVDFLRGCPEFTNEEKQYSDAAFKNAIQRSFVARGGKGLDEIEAKGRTERVTAGTDEDVGISRYVEPF